MNFFVCNDIKLFHNQTTSQRADQPTLRSATGRVSRDFLRQLVFDYDYRSQMSHQRFENSTKSVSTKRLVDSKLSIYFHHNAMRRSDWRIVGNSNKICFMS